MSKKAAVERSLAVQPIRFQKILPGFFLVLLLLLQAPALADAAVPLDEIGVRYFPLENEQTLTRMEATPEALARLGVDAETALQAMERDDLYLICLSPEGRQVSLRVTHKPEGLASQSVFQMDAMEKEQFLTLVARSGRYLTASFQDGLPGFALFSTQGEDDKNEALYTLSLSTLYLGRVYSFQTDVIGRAPTPGDTAFLTDVVSRALLLGAASQPEAGEAEEAALSLPAQPALTDQMAAFQVDRNDLDLRLEPVPSVVGSTALVLRGTTAPKAYVRYVVGGQASSRFLSEADGSFSVTVPNLEPDADNAIEVTSFLKSGETSTVRFSVRVQWQPSPLVLSKTGGAVEGDRLPLRGLTLPGAKVQLLRKTDAVAVPVAKDGSFSLDVLLKKAGENTFTLRSVAPGYRRTDVTVTVTRVLNTAAELKSLQKSVKPVSYDKLKSKPDAYEGRTVLYQGKVTALSYDHGQPAFLLTTEEGQSLVCLCGDLLGVQLGQDMTLIGTLTGELKAIGTRWATGSYPALELTAVQP